MSTPSQDTHFCPKPNELLKNGRYSILRKLGVGVTSSTWLVCDSLASPDKYAAAKILTAEATQELGPIREVDFLKKITQRTEDNEDEEGLDYLPSLHDHFTLVSDTVQTGQPSQHHFCIVQTLYSTSVSALRRSSPTKSLPIYMVRSIIYMTLQALHTLHSLRIVHTDLKLDNILFSNAMLSVDTLLEAYIEEHPSVIDSEGFHEAQPLPNEWTYETNAHDAERMTVALIDYGHGEWSDQVPLAEGFCAPALRPPEVILGADLGTGVDIWALGCLTFELLAGSWLFNPEDGGEDWSLEDDHLAKMLELTNRREFPKDVLDRVKLRDKYFDEKGDLIRIPELIPSIEQAMSNYKIPGLREDDIQEAADFIRSCLELDNTQRKTAKELLLHPFAKKAFSCQ